MSLITKKIKVLHFSNEETLGSKLFKLGILDTLNADLNSEIEKSFFGVCKVNNTIIKETDGRFSMNKVKYECLKPRKLNGEYKRREAILNSVIDRQIDVKYKFLNNIIENVLSIDKSKIFFELLPQYYQIVISR